MDYNNTYYFIQVAKAGSFTQAGLKLSIPKSTLSRKINELEKSLGITLIQRTTRKFVLTETGVYYYQNSLRILSELEELQRQVGQNQTDVKGLIKVTAPPEMGNILLPHIVKTFCTQYPDVQIELELSNKFVNLAEENIDLAIRASPQLTDSSLIAKKMSEDYFVMVASPDYIKKNPAIKTPQDLHQHKIIQFTHRPKESWSLVKNNEKYDFQFKKHLGANTVSACIELAKLHLGITFLPIRIIESELKKKGLVTVLPEWTSAKSHLYIVYPSQKFLAKRVRLFIDHVSNQLKANVK